jgi:anaerobic dimethyl sulfoxide reductase subunit B (iron-sulfur subunit)
MAQYGFYFNQSRCIGCNACTVACKQWNQLPPGPQKWMRVYQWEDGSFPAIRLHFLAIPCYHCEEPACVGACPNRAIYKEDRYGAVLIDQDRCRGSRRCWKACPYGSILFASDQSGERASKCTMCIDRLEEGKKPICVLSCSMRALEFGLFGDLTARFGELRDLEELPSGNITRPCVVFKAPDSKRPILPWNSDEALRLWKTRGSQSPQNSRNLFVRVQDLTEIPSNTIGRNRLVLKAKSAKELMYYTSDND